MKVTDKRYIVTVVVEEKYQVYGKTMRQALESDRSEPFSVTVIRAKAKLTQN